MLISTNEVNRSRPLQIVTLSQRYRESLMDTTFSCLHSSDGASLQTLVELVETEMEQMEDKSIT